MNTRPVVDGEPLEMLPDLAAVLRWFQAAGLVSRHEAAERRKVWGDSRAGNATVISLREWRECLRDAVTTWEAGHGVSLVFLHELSRLMAKHPVLDRITSNGQRAAMEEWFELSVPQDLFGPLARGAAMLFSTADRERVRKCENCVLHFLDTSKKGTRRWCSMELCGNRLKVAAYTARQRKVRSRPTSH